MQLNLEKECWVNKPYKMPSARAQTMKEARTHNDALFTLFPTLLQAGEL